MFFGAEKTWNPKLYHKVSKYICVLQTRLRESFPVSLCLSIFKFHVFNIYIYGSVEIFYLEWLMWAFFLISFFKCTNCNLQTFQNWKPTLRFISYFDWARTMHFFSFPSCKTETTTGTYICFESFINWVTWIFVSCYYNYIFDTLCKIH